MSWSTSRPSLAAVLAAAALALLLGAGCESMRDPNASDLPWAQSHEWETSGAVPVRVLEN